MKPHLENQEQVTGDQVACRLRGREEIEPLYAEQDSPLQVTGLNASG